MSEVVLWDYPKSSASYRVRIALGLAGIPYRSEIVNLLDGSQKSPEHRARNPQGFVPVLDIDGLRLTQSLAILEYLDATRALNLLPTEPAERAKAQALAMTIAVDLHPVCNLSVAGFAAQGSDDAKIAWMRHFIRPGLVAFEAQLAAFSTTSFATGDAPGLADLCLIPQLYNARRWGVDYSDLGRTCAVEDACKNLTAFNDAAPE